MADEEVMAMLMSLEQECLKSPNDELVPPGDRKCPICQRAMLVDSTDGVSIDVCEDHGVWLDAGELMTLLMRSHGRISATRFAAERKKQKEGVAMAANLMLISMCAGP